MNRKQKIIYFFKQFAIFGTLLYLIITLDQKSEAANLKRQANKTIACDSAKNTVRISTKKVTALSFLENPKELVPGNSSFDFKRVQNDIFIKSLYSGAQTNLFVFVGSRRCRFNLVTAENNVDDLLEVREPLENVMEVEFAK